MAWINGRDLDDPAEALHGVDPLTRREIADEGGRWRPRPPRLRPLTPAQSAALAAALAADEDIPTRLYLPRRGPVLGPAHLSTDRIDNRPATERRLDEDR